MYILSLTAQCTVHTSCIWFPQRLAFQTFCSLVYSNWKYISGIGYRGSKKLIVMLTALQMCWKVKFFQSATHHFSSPREGEKVLWNTSTQSGCQSKLYILCFDHCFLVALLSRLVRQRFLWKQKFSLDWHESRSQTTSMCYIAAGIFIYTHLKCF